MKVCEECGEDISFKIKSSKFCNSSCAAKYNNKCGKTGRKGQPLDDNYRQMMSDKKIQWHKDNGTARELKKCYYDKCDNSFLPTDKDHKYCSVSCFRKDKGWKDKGLMSKRTFAKIFKRALLEWHCPFCDWNNTYNIHHIQAVSKGGSDHLDNLVVLCPNHHSLADTGAIDIELLKTVSLSKIYNEGVFLEKFYNGDNELSTCKKNRSNIQKQQKIRKGKLKQANMLVSQQIKDG
jgi:hypothetical protein